MAEAIVLTIATEIVTVLSYRAFSQIGLLWNLKDELYDLERTVSTIKAVLLDAEERSVTNNLVKYWLEELKDVLYDAVDLLDDFSTEALRKDLMGGNKLTKEVRLFFSSSNQFAYCLKMRRKIKAIKARLTSTESKAKRFNLLERDHPMETSFMTKRRQQMSSFMNEGEIIGRDDDKAALLKLMLDIESEENVYVIPIVGFGGLEKTALAKFVYNDKIVRENFELRAWVYVSNVFDVKRIVKSIIEYATGQALDQSLEMDQLEKQLRDKIRGKKYLLLQNPTLVLDDIWNEEREAWLSLKNLLMGGAKGSRIIITTRSMKVAKITGTCQPYVLKVLSDENAWVLFKEIAFEQRSEDSTNPTFVKMGRQILERCGGVPLVIRTIASTLSFKETKEEWLSFINNNELARISEDQINIMPTLKLSYNHLPSHLKHCFAYCRLYPKDYVIHVQTLVQFWTAQGYINQLNPIDRSFFEEVGERFSREGLTCKMNNLMHDLAESVAGMESGVVDVEGDASQVGENCRHISINPSLINPSFKGKKLRTLLHFPNMRIQILSDETWDLIIANCRCLRLLKLDDIDFKMIPRSIHKLKHLRYLDLSHNRGLKVLPKSICKIQNLQVLKLDRCWELEELPKKIENLVNLTHLGCEDCNGLTHMPRGIGKLSSLETLSMFVVDKDGSHGGADLSELRGLNNLRGELRIRNLGFVKNAKEKFKAANLEEKQHLNHLQPHPNLKELCIQGWRGDAEFPSWISFLTNLVHIKIWGLGSKFKHLPSFAQFPCLQDLVICDLTELEYMDDNSPQGSQGEPQSFFPSLKYLCLRDFPNMKSWWRKRSIDDSNEDDTTVMAFPCPSCLKIENCPLTSMPLYPSLDDWLKLVNTSSRPLKQTMKMNMNPKTPSSSTSTLPLSKLKSFHYLQHLTSLKGLTIRDCKKIDLEGMQWEPLKNLSRLMIDKIPLLVSLPRGFQHLVQLKTLEISNCSGLRSLPVLQKPIPVFQHLTSLEEFGVRNCKDLELSEEDIQIFEGHTSLRYLTLENIPKYRHLPGRCKNIHNSSRNSPTEGKM
ncbi:hypothetical protein ES319_A11G347000v1 [Gossypium barbadense]|uniref:Rx N-terminal domain-containing protein n=1 Tax=Gossypium barbadense TaxID=3634 RepID=A0A5J5U036_GOSBA|nr:hypothetical protein ES319_A11G347000v1 [Gossypium barbadense]